MNDLIAGQQWNQFGDGHGGLLGSYFRWCAREVKYHGGRRESGQETMRLELGLFILGNENKGILRYFIIPT